MNTAVDLNLMGLAAAAAAFLGIWVGHVTVRYVEFRARALWAPVAVSILLGAGLETAALFSSSPYLAAVCGILGTVVLWSALEFFRQEKRIQKGHAPANPENPRHARILAAYAQATPRHWLDRDPTGHPIAEHGAIQKQGSLQEEGAFQVEGVLREDK